LWWGLWVCHTLRRKSVHDCWLKHDWVKHIMNTDSVFKQKECELIFLTMMYLTFFASNFLHRQSVCMFLRFSQILSSFLKLYDCCLFWFIISFCICWVTVIVICAHSVTSFIFCTIWSAFCTELLQTVQASTSQVVVEASCDTHETERRGSLCWDKVMIVYD
jgi:hypothetical protein